MILRKKSKTGGTTPLLILKIDYKGVVIKTVQYWPKNRHMDQRNRTESSEINLNKHGQFIFHEGAKNTQWGRDILFNKTMSKTGHPHAKE